MRLAPLALLVSIGTVIAVGVLVASTGMAGPDIAIGAAVLIVWFAVAVPLTAWLGQRNMELPEPEDFQPLPQNAEK